MDLGLCGKCAIVSGAARGIGECIARLLIDEGANVLVADLDEVRGKRLEEECSHLDRKGRLRFVRADVADGDSVRSLFSETENAFGAFHILINSHQWWPQAWFVDITDADWRRCLDINLTSYFLLCRAAVRHFLAHGISGRIVNITSQAAFRGSTTGHAHYAAAKAGIVGLTMSIAREVAGQGITVNGLAPGMAATPSTEEVLKTEAAHYESRIPLGRVARPEEVAAVAVFLASEKASYITGATIDVSGGLLMR